MIAYGSRSALVRFAVTSASRANATDSHRQTRPHILPCRSSLPVLTYSRALFCGHPALSIGHCQGYSRPQGRRMCILVPCAPFPTRSRERNNRRDGLTVRWRPPLVTLRIRRTRSFIYRNPGVTGDTHGDSGSRSSVRDNDAYTRFRLLRFLFRCHADPLFFNTEIV